MAQMSLNLAKATPILLRYHRIFITTYGQNIIKYTLNITKYGLNKYQIRHHRIRINILSHTKKRGTKFKQILVGYGVGERLSNVVASPWTDMRCNYDVKLDFQL